MVVAQKLKESEITEQDSLLLTRNLLRIAIFNITYIRKLFPEKYFSDKSVPALPEMKIKKLMPMDAESDRLINWMEKGVYDALQKKYLKTLLFSVCEAIDGPLIEEYAFSFCYSNTDSQDVSMNINRTGMKKGGTFKCNSTSELTPSQMRSSACKMVRTLIQLMRTLDKMPEERTLLMKLLYYTDVTPADYEPPFFRSCTDDEALNNTWTKNPLKIEVGNVNSKHIVLALKIKSSLDPCEDEKDDDNQQVNLDADSSEKIDSSSDSELIDSDDESIVTPVEKQTAQDKGDDDMVSEDDTQDPVADEQQFGRVKDWISTYHIDKVEVTDVLSNFPDVSVALIEEILGKLVKEGILSSAGTDTYIIIKDKKFNYEFDAVKEEMDGLQNQNGSQSQKGKDEDNLYMKVLFHALPMTYVSISKLQSKLEGEANQTTVKKLIDKMTQDGFVEAKSSRKLGKRVIRSDMTEKKLSEVKKVLANNDAMDVDTPESDNNNKRDLSTCGAVHSIGSELTRTKGKSDSYQNGSVRSDQTVSKRKDHEGTPSSKAEMICLLPVASLESFVPGEDGRVTGKINHHDEPDIVCSRSNQNKRRKKESMVKEPIILNVTHQSSTFTDKKSA